MLIHTPPLTCPLPLQRLHTAEPNRPRLALAWSIGHPAHGAANGVLLSALARGGRGWGLGGAFFG